VYISRIRIRNYRNFRDFDVRLNHNAVIVGENAVGKSNLFRALGLIFDYTASDADRELRGEDFWDGYRNPIRDKVEIEVIAELSGFGSQSLVDRLTRALLVDSLVAGDPPVARLTYLYRPRAGLTQTPTSVSEYEFLVYGGAREDARFDHNGRRQLRLEVFHALRDAERALSNWRTSPLRPLLSDIIRAIPTDRMELYASVVDAAAANLTQAAEIRGLSDQIKTRVARMVADGQSLSMTLGLTPSDPESLFRSLRIFVDDKMRDVGEASLGSTNVLYLALVSLALEGAVSSGERVHTILGIEEPEAHLHPHLQRLVYGDFLGRRTHLPPSAAPGLPSSEDRHGIAEDSEPVSISRILTTHSPHIVSVAPVRSLVVLRRVTSTGFEGESGTIGPGEESGGGTSTGSIKEHTIGRSTADLDLAPAEEADLERYLDVNRGEIVFARGVVLVEGEAEEYLLPPLALHSGYDLERLGISVCSIGGTHFEPFLRFLSPLGLDIPYVVLTDWDPVRATDADDDLPPAGTEQPTARTAAHGARRLIRLLSLTDPNSAYDLSDIAALRAGAAKSHIFANEDTLEVELLRSDRGDHFKTAFEECSATRNALDRLTRWLQSPTTLDSVKFLNDVNRIGKGRLAQSLAKGYLREERTESSRATVPQYIATALADLVSRLPSPSSRHARTSADSSESLVPRRP